MQTRKDPFVELETQFSDISAKKSKAINFLEARVQENTKLLKSIRPSKIIGSNDLEVISFFAIPRAIFATKTLLALGLGVAVGAAAVTVLLPITTALVSNKEGRQVVNDVVKSLTPELKKWKIPGAELRGGGIRGLENQSSIFNQTQNDPERNKIVSGNLAKIKILSTTESAEYQGFNADISKLNELRSSSFNKLDEIKKLEYEIEIKQEQTRIRNLIVELQKHRDEEIELIKGNLKIGDTLVVKDLPLGDGDQIAVKTQEFKRASSIGDAIKGSFPFSASRNLAKDDDRKLRRTESLSSLKKVDGSSTQSLFFSSNSRTNEEVQKIQEGIKKIDEGYKKEIDKLTQANRDLTTQVISLGENIREYKESIQKEKNLNDLKSLLNSSELSTEDILKKYDEIIGDTPATNPRANSFQAMRGGPILFRSNSNLRASADLSQNKNKSDLFSMLNDDERVKLEGIIDERMQKQQPLPRALSVGSGGALDAVMRSMGGARVMTL